MAAAEDEAVRAGGRAATPAGAPELAMRRLPPAPAAAVLLLHGGRSQDIAPPSRPNLPALRMVPFARAIARATEGHGVAIGTVRYRHRGWNGERADAAVDAARAVEALAEALGPVPVVLVGHSMGARAALRVAGDPLVRGVVALAPWCPPDEPVAQLAGRQAVLLHCPSDRITDPRGSWAFVRRARAAGADACGVAMPYGGHAMLRHAADWHQLAGTLAAGLLGVGTLPAPLVTALSRGADAGDGGPLGYADLVSSAAGPGPAPGSAPGPASGG